MPGQPGPAVGRPGYKLVPGIHAFPILTGSGAWMTGTSPATTSADAGVPLAASLHFNRADLAQEFHFEQTFQKDTLPPLEG